MGKSRGPYKVRSAATSAVIRSAVLDGDLTAAELAPRHGMAKSTLVKRARREGWRKRDLAEALESEAVRARVGAGTPLKLSAPPEGQVRPAEA